MEASEIAKARGPHFGFMSPVDHDCTRLPRNVVSAHIPTTKGGHSQFSAPPFLLTANASFSFIYSPKEVDC